eukprot:jgi/Ulvmu1/11082/UM007_0264.1
MHSAGIRGFSNCCSGQGRASAKPFVRLPGQQRQVQTGPVDREVHSTALPLQELASAATTLGFLGDTPTEVFASAGLLLTAAGILVVEAVQSNAFANPVSETEARQEEVEAWIAAFRARTEAEATQPLVSPDVTPVEVKPVPTSADDKASPSNPVAAFFSWIRALWTAIINLFKQDSGSKPQTA